MRKRKMIVTILLGCLSAFVCSAYACKNGGDASSSSSSEEVVFQDPELADVTVDISDRPEGMYVGDAEISEVRFSGVEGEFDDYIVREDYFLLTYEYYGDVGLGEDTLDFTFENYQATSVKITVVDQKAPDYSMPEGNFFAFETGIETTLPELTRNRKYQSYDVGYTLKDSKGEAVFTAGAGTEHETPTSAAGFAVGEYIYEVTVSKGSEELEKKAYNVVVGCGENIFAAEKFGGWAAQANQDGNIGVSFDEENNAVKATRRGDNTVAEGQFTSNNNRIYFADMTAFKEMYEAGYETYTFYYKSALTDGATAKGYYGFRIYANDASLATNGNMKTQLRTVSQASGSLVTGEWTQVSITLADLFSIGKDSVCGLSIVVCGDNGSSVLFRHGYFGMTSSNVFGDEYAWTVTNADQLASAYNQTEQATQISKKTTTDNGLTGRYFVAYVAADKIKAEYEKGMKEMSFQAKATASDVQLRVYAKKNGGLDGAGISDNAAKGIGVYGDYVLTNEYTTYRVDLTKFFTAKSSYIAYDEIKYFAIVISSATVGELYFKDATYSTEVHIEQKDYTKENLFSATSAGSWTVQGNVAKAFDSTASALKVTVKNGTDGYNQFTSNNRRIYVGDGLLREAYEAGCTKFTFEYNASALTDPATSGNYGFRVYTNSAAAVANSNVKKILTTVSKADNNLVTTDTWTKVEIDLATMFADGADVCGISIVVVGKTDSYLLLRNGTFVKGA